jgi:hypothetical protein
MNGASLLLLTPIGVKHVRFRIYIQVFWWPLHWRWVLLRLEVLVLVMPFGVWGQWKICER